MTEEDCSIETTTAAIYGYLEGMIIGNRFANDLDSLVTLSQKLQRDIVCTMTVKYDMSTHEEDE